MTSLHIDSEGFESNVAAAHKSSKERKQMGEREKLWLTIMQDFPAYKAKHEKKLQTQIRQHGIPPMFRNRVWQYLAGSEVTVNTERQSSEDVYLRCKTARNSVLQPIHLLF